MLNNEQEMSQAAPRDFISSQDVWSRRSFIKAGVCSGGVLLMHSNLTEELMAVQQTARARSTDPTALSLREAGELVRRKAISPVELTRACLERIERLNPAPQRLHHRDRGAGNGAGA